ncbi:hypothetical protein A2Z33_07310 [Candidatus Gottesmanbacteria bacterium RBG_16_52_11]|uniref:NodB homology domain-containing protein n=1 Tax=Candidatus Gottesmanbacteria bacterium RBG_16_52_11 TaxID=1798374 RepID=A0A1F5YXY6_9BACT|nr:MAG: hypothetical protein A2Z33_07310 [Candidatus Gottesmanbacteria bacterium RBG_16_52_11]
MKSRVRLHITRLPLLTWLGLPLLVLYLSVNYFLGESRNPDWVRADLPGNGTLPAEAAIPTPPPLQTTPVPWDRRGIVTIWFDDAWQTQYTISLPIMESFGFRGALAVPTLAINNENYMSWAQVRRMQFKGWEIASHTRNHICESAKFDEKTVDYELNGSYEDLRRQGIRADFFVSPCGIELPGIREIAKQHYLGLRTVEPGFTDLPPKDVYFINGFTLTNESTVGDIRTLLSETKASLKWLNIIFHSIDESGSKYSVTPDTFSAMLEEVRNSGLPVLVPSEVLSRIFK